MQFTCDGAVAESVNTPHGMCQTTVLGRALDLLPFSARWTFSARLPFSCFPFIPGMSRRGLGLEASVPYIAVFRHVNGVTDEDSS